MEAKFKSIHVTFVVDIWHEGKRLERVRRVENKPYFKASIEANTPEHCLLGCHAPKDKPAWRCRVPPRASVTISTYLDAVEWRPLAMMPEDSMGL